jgi:hypothetical protein
MVISSRDIPDVLLPPPIPPPPFDGFFDHSDHAPLSRDARQILGDMRLPYTAELLESGYLDRRRPVANSILAKPSPNHFLRVPRAISPPFQPEFDVGISFSLPRAPVSSTTFDAFPLNPFYDIPGQLDHGAHRRRGPATSSASQQQAVSTRSTILPRKER